MTTRDELQKIITDVFHGGAQAVVDAVWLKTPLSVPPPKPPCIDDAGLAAFFDYVRQRPPLGPGLQAIEVDGCKRILAACSSVRWPLSWVAYALATTYHETAGTMQPLREIGRGVGRPYGVPGKHNNQIAYGRGYVQLTWDANYERADKELGLNGALIANFDLALNGDIAARILVSGMEGGWFTGKGLQDFLPATADVHQFSNARRVINALDKAVEIAGYALVFQTALEPVWKC